jgi:hypothetical protein
MYFCPKHALHQCCGSRSGGSVINWPPGSGSGFVILNEVHGFALILIKESTEIHIQNFEVLYYFMIPVTIIRKHILSTKDHRNFQVEPGFVNQDYVSADPDPKRNIYGSTDHNTALHNYLSHLLEENEAHRP